ncbi:hypothetical protein AC579_775 [Pseudocercospora musae]|uniref:Ubiquitin-like protease family profile domain-containing protein n=1 Tax=Pseudocercospora musae TaxID=113226 RepID=A0A139IHR3_9PEZI|nr:hypothetical protein AC579_775 [Pseudocercospora musae]
MEGIWTSLNSVKSLVTGAASKYQGEGHVSHTTNTTTTNVARSPSVEETTSARGSPDRKRVRLSDTDRHLSGGDYTVYANGAIPFQPVAATREENAADIEARRRAGKMGAPYKPKGSVRPANTLGSGTKQASTTTKGAFFSRYNKQVPGLDMAMSRGGNVKRKGFPDDGEDQMMQPSAKRHHHANGPTSSPIDLTDGEDHIAGKLVRVVSQKPVEATSGSQGSRHAGQPRQQKLSSQTDTFGNDQRHKVDSLISPDHRGKNARRIARSELNLGQSGPRAAGDLRRRQHGTRDLPEEIQDDSQPMMNSHTRAMAEKQSRPAESKAIQPINLDPGVFDEGVRHYQEKKREKGQGGTRDMDNVTSVFQNKNHRAARSPTKGSTARRTIPQQLPDAYFQIHANSTAERRPTASAKLADQFQRDTEDPVDITKAPTKTKAAERMQTYARPGSSGEGSVDELQGERTVPPRSSRSISPRKPFKQPTMSNGTSLKRKAPTAATQPANIHAKPIKPKQGYRAPAPEDDDELDENDDGLRIPINAIYCKALVSTAKQLELVWSSADMAYQVVQKEEIVMVPRTDRPILIASNDIREFWYSSRGHLGVQLKCSSGEVNNGHIIIQFDNREDLDRVRDGFTLDNSLLKTREVAANLIDGIVKKQAVEQAKAYELAQKRAAPMAPGRESSRPGRLIHNAAATDDEDITYEEMGDDDSTATALLKDNHQKPRPCSSAADQIVSPYFEPNQLRRSARECKLVAKARSPTPVQTEKWTQNNDISFWQHEMTWPWIGKNRVSLFPNDLEKLDEEEMLNDNIINFGLRYTEEIIRPELKDKVYWFNTYFYDTLIKGPTGKGINYAGVERWTKNVDLFTKPYIVVPINLSLHWFVAIICNLTSLQRKFADSDPVDTAVPSSQPVVQDESDSTRLQPPDQEMTDLALSDADVESKPVSDDEKDAIEWNFQFGDDGKVVGADVEDEQQATGASKGRGRKKKKKKAPPGPRKIDPSTPVILTFDSFGFSRSKEIKVLKDYLVKEAKTKRNMELNASQIPQMTAKGIPGQKNFSDCGVYLLGYIEKFAQNPEEFVRKLLQFEMREEDFEFDPSQKRAAIRDQLLEFSRQNEDNILKAKEARRDAKRRANGASAQKQIIAEGSSPARQKTSTPAPTPINEAARSRQQTPARAAERAGLEASSRGKTQHGATEAAINAYYPTSQTFGNEDEEFSVSPPRVAGGRSKKQSNATDTPAFGDDQPSSDDSEEMLDSGDKIHVSNEQQTSLVPQPISPADRESKSPLGTVQAYAEDPAGIDDPLQDGEPEDNALSPEDTSSAQPQQGDDDPDVIDIGDEDDNGPANSPEIPDSQPTQGR